MDTLKKLLLCFFMLYICSGCRTGVSYDPDFRVSEKKEFPDMLCSFNDYGVVSEKGEYVSCSSQEFTRMACLTEDKIKELADILSRAEIPAERRRALLKEFHKSLWWEDR